MKEVSTLVVVALVSLSQPAKAETRVVSDTEAEPLCERARAELRQIGIPSAILSAGGTTRRARRRAFSDPSVQALVACRSKPMRLEVFYADGSRLGTTAFVVTAADGDASGPVYASERIRAERFVADVAEPIPYAPPVWWLGIGADVFFSPGGVAPLAFVTLDAGYRFHRHWSLQVFASIQPYMRRLDTDSAEARIRLDEFGAALAYHPLVRPRVDLAIAARAAAARLGANGTNTAGGLDAQRDEVWLAFPAGRVLLRVGLTDRVWLRFHGDIGALLPKAAVAAGAQTLGSLGPFAAQAGLGLEVDFR
ncbi:MAG: hypothetical protein WBN38_18555 [Polyangiales bacterium]